MPLQPAAGPWRAPAPPPARSRSKARSSGRPRRSRNCAARSPRRSPIPRDVAEQARLRLAASRRLIRDEAGRAAAVVEEAAAGEALDGLHGNARRGLARGIRREVDRMAAEVNLVIDRVAAAADAIEGAQ